MSQVRGCLSQHIPKHFPSLQKAFRPQAPAIDCAELEKSVDDYIWTNDTLREYTKPIGLDNIDKVVKELQAESAWARVKGRQTERADDFIRLVSYLQTQQSKEAKPKSKAKRVAKVEMDVVRTALHRLQLDENVMAAVCGLARSKLEARNKREQELHSHLRSLMKAHDNLNERVQALNASDAAKRQELEEILSEAEDGWGQKEKDELMEAQSAELEERGKLRAGMLEELEGFGKEFEELRRQIDENEVFR